MSVEVLPGTFHSHNGRSGPLASSTSSSLKDEYKLHKYRLEKLDHSITDLPKCFDAWLNSLGTYCKSGAKLASVLEVVLDDTPLLGLILKHKEACEVLSEKCLKQELLLKPEFVAACKKVGPSVGSLRSDFDLHAKLLSKYESAQTQLENISNSDSKSKAKVEQADLKFKNALQEFSNQDSKLVKSINDLDNVRVEVRYCD